MNTSASLAAALMQKSLGTMSSSLAQTGIATTSKKESAHNEGSFAGVLKNVQKTERTSNSKKSEKVNSSNDSYNQTVGNQSSDDQQSEVKTTNDNQPSNEKTQENQKADTDQMKETEVKPIEKNDKPMDELEEISEELLVLPVMDSENLMQNIADVLDMSVEDLSALLDKLNMTVEDLFEFDNLKMLLAETMEVANPVDLLVTDGAIEKLSELMTVVEEAVSDAGQMNKTETVAKEDVAAMLEQPESVSEEEPAVNLVEETKNYQESTGEKQSENQSSDSQISAKPTMTESANSQTQVDSGFENMLNQVVTQKTETIVMDGQIQTIRTEVTAKDVFNQIVTGMKVQVTPDKSNMTLQLSPENLGKISLNLSQENGSLTGHFVAESEAVREVLEANMSQLKAQLSSQGVEVGEIKITVGNAENFFREQTGSDSTNEQNKQKSNKRHRIGNIEEFFTDNIIEDEAEKSLIHENSSIELHA